MTSTAAIVGSGNIGTDLLMKMLRSHALEVHSLVGIDSASEGLARARELGVRTSAEGVDWLLAQKDLPDFVFEATSASAHAANAQRYADAGIVAVDLTPAAVGPLICPPVNLGAQLDVSNVNMITCGGQATVPIVNAISRVVRVPYAEIVASVSSRSAGPGTRANIDEFTETTAHAVESVGGAERGKAIIILNPAKPDQLMRNTVFCALEPGADEDAVTEAIHTRVAEVQEYVPGYRLRSDPQFDAPNELWGGVGRVAVFIEVEGRGDFLPPWAGNLDIMTSAALRVGELLATSRKALA